jgi:hypothetical protein
VVIPGRVQFFGEVKATIPLHADAPPLLLTDAILGLAPSDFADLRRIKIHRLDPVTHQPRTVEVNVREILRSGRRHLDVPLQDGDRVYVPQKWIN